MADVERKRRLQHVHETNALTYGHLGTATYEEKDHQWTFLRNLDPQDEGPDLGDGPLHWKLIHERERIRQFGGTGPASIIPLQLRTLDQGGFNELLKRAPEAVLALTELDASEYAAEALPHALSDGDDKPLGYLTFGNAFRPGEHGVHAAFLSTSVAALSVGINDEAVMLLTLGTEKVSPTQDSDTELTWEVPTLSDEHVAVWKTSAEPVEQLCFADDGGRPRLMVRKGSCLSIFEPQVRSTSVYPHRHLAMSDRGQLKPSMLDVNPVLTIPMSRTGGHSHADTSFHPRDSNLLAIVDARGNWSIWRIRSVQQARATRPLSRAQLQSSGRLCAPELAERARPPTPSCDEWHQIRWLRSAEGVFDRLLVCNRHMAVVFDLQGEVVGVANMRLGPRRVGNQIIDVRQSAVRPEFCFVLTTTRLMLMDSAHVGWKDPSDREPLTLVCSWNHFRNPSDLSLRMSLLEQPQKTYIVLYSRRNQLATVYQFGQDPRYPSTMASRADPFILELPKLLRQDMRSVGDLVFRSVQIGAQDETPQVHQADLFQLFACTGDGRVVEALYLGRTRVQSPSPGPLHQVCLPFRGSRALRARSAKFVDVDLDDLDDFVVGDDEVEATLQQDDHLERPIIESPRRPQDSKLRGEAVDHYDWEDVLEDEESPLQRGMHANLTDSLHQLGRRLQTMKMHDGEFSLHVLSDVLLSAYVVDVDEDSQSASAWLNNLRLNGDSPRLRVTSMDGVYSQSLLDSYHYLVRYHVDPLSPQVADRIRVNRERLARQISADAFFASHTAQPEEDLNDEEPGTVRQASHHPPRESSLFRDDSGLEEDQEPPSSLPHSPGPRPADDPVMTRLRAYTTFTKPLPPTSLITQASFSEILAHLPSSVAVDPSTYSYRGTNATLSLARSEQDKQSLDPRERRRAERLAAARQRKLEKQAKMSRDVMTEQGILPSVMSGSDRERLPWRGAQSSQLAGLDSSPGQSWSAIPGLSMTQPERGAFGTRTVKHKAKGKGKGKERKAGF